MLNPTAQSALMIGLKGTSMEVHSHIHAEVHMHEAGAGIPPKMYTHHHYWLVVDVCSAGCTKTSL
jgi:hypothetical protein